MKNKHRLTALALAGSLTALLAACGGGSTSPTGSGDRTGSQNPNETVTLEYWTIGGEPADLQMVNDAINEYAGEKIGVNVNIHYSDWGSYGNQLTTMLNTQEYWDIAFGSSIPDYGRYAQQGLFADLSGSLDTVAKDLKEFIPEDLWSAVTLDDGTVYGVPAYKDSSMTQYFVFDKAMLQELGFEATDFDSFESLEPLLAAYKEKWPDKYPLMINQDGIAALMSDSESVAGPVRAKFGETNVVNIWKDEDFINRLKMVRSWNEAGYINPDANTRTEPVGPEAQIFVAQGFPGADVNWSQNQGYEVVSNPFFGPIYTNESIQGSFMSVYAGSTHVDKAMEYLQLQNLDWELRNMVAFGIEGVHFEKTGDTTIKKLPASDNYGAPAYSQGTFFTLYTMDPAPANQWDLVKQQTEEAVGSPLLGFLLDRTEIEAELATLSNISTKYHGTLMTGSGDVDSTLEAMYAEQETAGIEDVITEVQSQIDAFLAD